jgi:uncharacterized protein (DUF488 family)
MRTNPKQTRRGSGLGIRDSDAAPRVSRSDPRVSSPEPRVIYTIGHSTRSLDDFIALLKAHGVTQLADVRSVPRSRRHPHFGADALSVSLPAAGIAYRHFPGLGGMRKPRRDSTNTAWRHEGFRGYADYMQTDAFEGALDELVAFAAHQPTAIMCAEAVWWRCHRQLTADALVARGIEVRHITSPGAAPPHTLTEFGRPANGKVTYPGLV